MSGRFPPRRWLHAGRCSSNRGTFVAAQTSMAPHNTGRARHLQAVEVLGTAVSSVSRTSGKEGSRPVPLADTVERVLDHSILVERDPEGRRPVIPPSGWVHVGNDRFVVAEAIVNDGSGEKG